MPFRLSNDGSWPNYVTLADKSHLALKQRPTTEHNKVLRHLGLMAAYLSETVDRPNYIGLRLLEVVAIVIATSYFANL